MIVVAKTFLYMIAFPAAMVYAGMMAVHYAKKVFSPTKEDLVASAVRLAKKQNRRLSIIP